MRSPHPFKRALSGACFALGTTWATAGALRLLFGAAITFPLLPPIDLGRVHEVSAFAFAFCYLFAGAMFGRSAAKVPACERTLRLVPDDDGDDVDLPAPIRQVMGIEPFTKHRESV